MARQTPHLHPSFRLGLYAALGLALTACAGDDGPTGATGPQGPAGAQGAAGNDGQNGDDGMDGADGLTAGIRSTILMPGEEGCEAGGVRFETGIDDNGDGTLEDPEVDDSEIVCNAMPGASAFSLHVLHSSDNESSFQDPNTLEEKVVHYSAVTAGLQALAQSLNLPTLHLTAGDHTIPGPFYQASAEITTLGQPGLADIAIYNALGLTANGMGNHEFDGGIDEFAHMLAAADYPFLACNLDFTNVTLGAGVPAIEIGTDGADVTTLGGKVARSAYVEVNGERIGLIGRAPADFFNVIQDPPNTIPGLDFVGGRDPQTNQPLVSAVSLVLEQVRLLEGMGIDKIILLDHAQDFTGDPLAADRLRGIDIVVAAGSTGFMAKPFAEGPFNMLRPGDGSSANYPTVRLDAEGHRVVVVNSDQLYAYIGNLIVGFDYAGHVDYIDPISGPVATTQAAIDALNVELGSSAAAPIPAVRSALDELQATPSIQAAFSNVGTTATPLNGLRADVRTRETNLGRLAADSTLWAARQAFPARNVDVALKNGGGIRDTIAGPAIIRLTVQAALAFDNTLTIIDLTGPQLLAAMENSVSRNPAADGRFPQVAGMVVEYDRSQPGVQGQVSTTTPSRIRTLTVTRANGTVENVVTNGVFAPAYTTATFALATNSFTATGGDGYAAFAAGANPVSTTTGEQQILLDYISAQLSGAVDIQDPPPNPRVFPVVD